MHQPPQRRQDPWVHTVVKFQHNTKIIRILFFRSVLGNVVDLSVEIKRQYLSLTSILGQRLHWEVSEGGQVLIHTYDASIHRDEGNKPRSIDVFRVKYLVWIKRFILPRWTSAYIFMPSTMSTIVAHWSDHGTSCLLSMTWSIYRTLLGPTYQILEPPMRRSIPDGNLPCPITSFRSPFLDSAPPRPVALQHLPE